MNDPRDILSLTVGTATAGVGAVGLTAADIQLMLSIVASATGIILTLLTLWWRHNENKRRVKWFEEHVKRIEDLEKRHEREESDNEPK